MRQNTSPLPHIQAHGIIPARYGSSRLPGKPLLMLHDKPMFWHVWQRASLCPHLASVTVATDDSRIALFADELGVPCLMTSTSHQSGTDRVREAAELLGLSHDAIVVNIQGDEPALNPAVLSELLCAFNDASVQAATLAHELDPSDLERPDKVKVVVAANGDALYFSRAGIPYARDERIRPALGHIGLYAFTRKTLDTFVSLVPSSLERTEKLEQLRLLENGIPIRVVLTRHTTHGIDVQEDIARVLPLLKQ